MLSMDTIKEQSLLIEESTIRYKFIFTLFILCLLIFNEKTFNFMKKQLPINKSYLIIVHSLLFVTIVYIMLKTAGSSFTFSPSVPISPLHLDVLL